METWYVLDWPYAVVAVTVTEPVVASSVTVRRPAWEMLTPVASVTDHVTAEVPEVAESCTVLSSAPG